MLINGQIPGLLLLLRVALFRLLFVLVLRILFRVMMEVTDDGVH